MNEEALEQKTELVPLKITPTMDKAIKDLMEKKKWNRSAFIRVAIQKELERIKSEG